MRFLTSESGATIVELTVALPVFFIFSIALAGFSFVSVQHGILTDSLRDAGRKGAVQTLPRMNASGRTRGCADIVNAVLRDNLRKYGIVAASAVTELSVESGLRGLKISVDAGLICPQCSMLELQPRFRASSFFPLEDQSACAP